MKRIVFMFMLVSLVSVSTLADGTETGIVEGKVTDRNGAGLPGVTVVISGDRGDKAEITNSEGTYRFALLVPGGYSLKASLEGFQDRSATLAVTAGRRSTIDLELRLGTEEEITVVSEAPMVDRFNVTAGSTMAAEVGEEVAGVNRTYYGMINTLPGVTADARNDDSSGTQPSVNGTHFADQGVFIEGVDTTYALTGGSRVFVPTTSVSEIAMEAGGSAAEYGRYRGSVTNVIVRSGTNQFHFSAQGQRQDTDWGADYKNHVEFTERQNNPYPADWLKRCKGDASDDSRGQSLIPGDFSGGAHQPCIRGVDESDASADGYELSVGGPLKRDKAWFFLGASDFDDHYQTRALNGDPVDKSFNFVSRIAKVNLQPSNRHSLSVSYIESPSSNLTSGDNAADYHQSYNTGFDSDLGIVSWNYTINSNLFLETKLATQNSSSLSQLGCGGFDAQHCIDVKAGDRGPQAGHTPSNSTGGDTSFPLRYPGGDPIGQPFLPGNNLYLYQDSENLNSWYNGFLGAYGYGENEFPRDQANFALTQFLGANHEIKYGIDFQNTQWEAENQNTAFMLGYGFDATNPFGYLGAGTDADDTCSFFRNTTTSPTNPGPFGRTTRGRLCVFVDYNAEELQALRGTGDSENQDTGVFIRDRFTVGDHWIFNIGLRGELQEGWNDTRRKVIDDTYVDPRISATYDLRGDGKLLFNANYGTYHSMLNLAWIGGGGGTAGGMLEKWNGVEGSKIWLFCDSTDAFIGQFFGFCQVPDRPDTRANGTVGLPLAGYNFPVAQQLPGLMWQAIDAGMWNHDLKIPYKEEIVLGMEWQVSNNWAFDVKYIDWRMKDMLSQTTQTDHLGRQIFMTINYEDLIPAVIAMEDAYIASGFGEPELDRDVLATLPTARNSYRGIQLQLNKRFSNGFAVYNNVSFSETDTTGAGEEWSNTNADYMENLGQNLTQDQIDGCNANMVIPDRRTGRTRTDPVDCQAVLGQFLGQPVSTINRRGANNTADRPIIFNSAGYKVWNLGSHNLTLGGHLTFQSGMPWIRTETTSIVNRSPFMEPGTGPTNTDVLLYLSRPGDERRSTDEYTLNLSGAWGLPLGGRSRGFRGELRVEVINVTNEQKLRERDRLGEVYPTRIFFQRPRQVRASFRITM